MMMAATDRKMRQAVQAVRYNRESIEDMMKKRSGSIGETLKQILAEEKAGVINAAVLEFAAREIVRMNRLIIDGNRDIREAMKQADGVIERMDSAVKGDLQHAAAMKEEDIERLDDYLKEALPGISDAERAAAKVEEHKVH